MSIKLVNINKNYDGLNVLKDFSFEFSDGEITCFLGRSGSGKTTILNILSGLIDFQGTVEGIDGDISYIFQKERLIPKLTVYKNLEYVLLNKIKDKTEREKKINTILKLVGMEDKKDNFPSELSGGMSQRVSMARAFLYPGKILLMDEPFKALDIALKSNLIAAFLKLWENDKKTVIFVTHDIDEALMLSDRIAVIRETEKEDIKSQNDNLSQEKNDFSEMKGNSHCTENPDSSQLKENSDSWQKKENSESSQIILDEKITISQNIRNINDKTLTDLRARLYNAIINS